MILFFQNKIPFRLQVLYLIFAISIAMAWVSSFLHNKQVNSLHENVLRLSITTDPLHLDPAYAGDAVSGMVLRMINEGLTRLNEQGLPEPALAQSWKVSADGREYIFYLRRAHWSNGDPLTAHDFVRAWQRMLSHDVPAPNAYLLFPIQHARLIKFNQASVHSLGAQALNDWTLRVTLEEPIPYFLQLLAFDAFFPVYSSSPPVAPNSTTHSPICCGPFILKSWKPKNELTFEPNPYYWDRSHVYMDRIDLLVIADSQTALHLFEQGSLDWIGAPLSPIPIDAIENLSKSGSIENYAPSSTYWVHCNLQNPVLRNQKARYALSMAIDRQRLARVLGEQYTPATGIIPPIINLRNSPCPNNLTFDPEKANHLWQEALKNLKIEEPVELLYIYNTSGMNNLHSKVAQLLQSQWKEHLGLEVKLQGVEWAIFFDRARQGAFDLSRFGWGAQWIDPTTFLEIFEMQDGAYNFSRYDDPIFRQLLDWSRHCETASRAQVLELAHQRLIEELPIIPLFFGSYSYLKNPHLKGVVKGPLGRLDFKSAYWEISKK